MFRSLKKEKSVQHPPRPSPSPAKGGFDHGAAYLEKFKMADIESSPLVGLKSKMKRKKSEEIPLASLRNDSQTFEKFKSSSGFVVGPFRLMVSFEEKDFKLA